MADDQHSYAATTQNHNNATTTPDNDDATTSRDDNHTATVQAGMQPHQERGHPWTAQAGMDAGDGLFRVAEAEPRTTTTRGEGLARSKGHNNGRQPRATDNDSTMGRQYHFWLHGNLGESVFRRYESLCDEKIAKVRKSGAARARLQRISTRGMAYIHE
ncbi:uncharacterized protein LACBIDRAFT_325695 [Laccaria bicolor S238N-H82]|uniref:Predicted protein n=1 Tax=Laccaria bicolor (strain S238N-H82 / ATCC MYA-4686) TaxID=486041 RepID=B0D5W8_LACBS|nr:uncharacterized protein LACBIDRAFT_325695 [Laccaria bicolor S238N-H82]EDR09842.1 predicted protein [Laccaria bicolor S238N-H82]|eukprot:XP_001879227.1 predicted protein [Laccaria bicolor S238N-H82]